MRSLCLGLLPLRVLKSWDKWLGTDKCEQFRGIWGAADSNECSVLVPPRLAWVDAKASKVQTHLMAHGARAPECTIG